MSEITDDIIRANFEPQWKYGDIDAVKADIARLTAELAAALKRAEAAEQSESGLARALTTAMAELAALREQTRWIPVSERLPLDCELVNLFDDCNGPRLIGYRVSNIPQWTTTCGLHYHGKKYDWITHWMPLPPTPEAENEN